MGSIVLYTCLTATAISAVVRPWIGVVAAYLFVILAPQTIWWWAFEGVRPVLWTLVPTLIGIFISLIQGKLNCASLKTKQNIFLLILWICFIISSYAGPYVGVISTYRWFTVEWERTLVNNMFLLYFAAILLIDSEKKLKCMALVMVISTLYLIYWCNDQYLTHQQIGRFGGPAGPNEDGVYADENAFAMLFVTGLPFVYYYGLYQKNKISRYGLWLFIPLGWHAVFLTGSRGGLSGLVITLLVSALRTTRRIVAIGLLACFILAYQWQAGDTMKGRAGTILDYQEESSAESRLNAWKAAIGMVKDNPLIGVGLASFGPAFPHYSTNRPRMAHNTFFQIAAESGVLACIMYLLIVATNLIDLWRNGNTLRQKYRAPDGNFLYCMNEALLTSFIGLVVCSVFLSLNDYEIFYFLCVLTGTLALLFKQKL